jgi:hypothetical protein
MKRKFLYSLFALLLINTMFIGCKRDLTVIPNNTLSDADVFTDKELIRSVLAQFYAQINGNNGTGANWGASNQTDDSFQQDPDDAVNNRGAASAGQVQFTKDRYRAFDYGLIRRINQFLVGIRSDVAKKAMTPFENSSFEGQAMFLRAWTFFHMVKSLGGMSIVNDQVFDYTGGDVTPLLLPRNSEADCYDYIITQCDQAAALLSTTTSANGTIPAAQNVNATYANKWACLMLKARAAITAASIAKWTTPGDLNMTKTDKFGTQTHGIPATKADGYYTAAFNAAKAVIDGGAYTIMTGSTVATAQQAFQDAINKKAGNTEVIWTSDRLKPSIFTEWTRRMAPLTHTDDGAFANQLGAGAEFVESFEDRVAGVRGPQGIPTRTGAGDAVGAGGPALPGVGSPLIGTTAIMYDLDPTRPGYDVNQNPFMKKDARLYASVIWPYAPFKGIPVDLRAGEWRGGYNADGSLQVFTSTPGARAAVTPYSATVLTSINGPFEGSSAIINKTGFIPRKWLDETPLAGQGPSYSDVWVIHFRLAEAYAIAAEAALLSSPLGGPAVGVNYINVLRRRGLLADLTAGQFDFEQLKRELRIEFYLEDHRLWDMNRWRLADSYWDGVTCSKCTLYPNGTSFPWQLYGYIVNIAGNPGGNNGKWVFERKRAFRKRANPNSFQRSSYYSTMNSGTNWLTFNPNWEKNPGE